MHIDEYLSLDGLALSRLLSDGKTTPAALMDCAIALARELPPEWKAICHPQYEAGRRWAAEWRCRGVFQGIPFLLKDSGVPSLRLNSSIGSRLFADMRFGLDATVVERFEAAGLLPFARTSVPELCMAPTTEAAANGGPTRNPWDPTRSAGGSSGGAAVAVAAGVVPLAHASDGGGSIRIPAACCGVYGLKPSRGLVPAGPLRGEIWGGLATDGVLSRTVRDTAAAMDAIAGAEPGAPYATAVPAGGYGAAASLRADRPPLRIAAWREPWAGIAVDPVCLQAVEQAVAICRDLGHEVIDAPAPAVDYPAFVRAHIDILAANIVVAVDLRLQSLGRALRDDDLEPAIQDGYRIGKALPAARYVAAIQTLHAVGHAMAAAMRDVDLMLTPALTSLPAPLGRHTMNQDFEAFRQQVARYTTFLTPANASGQPAAVLPLHWTSAPLPVAVQLIGHFGRDDVVLRCSAELEAAAPWAHRLALRPHKPDAII